MDSPQWTGFYRLEYGLWHGQSARQLTPVADGLDADVRALRASWPSTEINLLDIGLRTHEILENALEFQLTGHDDYVSGTTLATAAANVTGTLELLTVLRPLLVVRYPALPAVCTGLDHLTALLDQTKRPNGPWVPVSQLSASSRVPPTRRSSPRLCIPRPCVAHNTTYFSIYNVMPPKTRYTRIVGRNRVLVRVTAHDDDRQVRRCAMSNRWCEWSG